MIDRILNALRAFAVENIPGVCKHPVTVPVGYKVNRMEATHAGKDHICQVCFRLVYKKEK